MEVSDLSLKANSGVKPPLQKVRSKAGKNSSRGARAYPSCLSRDPQTLDIFGCFCSVMFIVKLQSSGSLYAGVA